MNNLYFIFKNHANKLSLIFLMVLFLVYTSFQKKKICLSDVQLFKKPQIHTIFQTKLALKAFSSNRKKILYQLSNTMCTTSTITSTLHFLFVPLAFFYAFSSFPTSPTLYHVYSPWIYQQRFCSSFCRH